MEDINSVYTIKTRTIILSEYNEFLYQLYLPLIGYKAVFLYEYLTNEYRYGKIKLTLSEIIDRSSLNLQDFIFERKMLESVGLISTFNEGNKYIIVLNAILSPKNFFNDDVLKGLLISKVGKTRVAEIMKRYEINDSNEGYKEISAEISENFIFDYDYEDLSLGKNIKLAGTNKIDRNDDFDDLFFLKQLQKLSNIKTENITKNELKKIHNLGVLYNINERVMAEIVRDCYEGDKILGEKINLETLNSRVISEVIAAKSYNKRKKIKKVSIDSNTDIAKKVEYYQSITPREFLKQKQNGVEPVTSDLYIVQYLNENMEFDYSVINALLDYCLEKNQNQLNRKYIEKVAASLKRDNCETCLDALNFLYKGSGKEVVDKIVSKRENVDSIEENDEEYEDFDKVLEEVLNAKNK